MCFSMLFVTTLTVMGQAAERHDGNWWTGLSEGEKVFYLVGYVDGITTGGDIAKYQGVNPQPPSSPGCTAAKTTDFSHSKFGQLEQGLDSFYKDFRNTSIPSFQALLYVRDQISGCSDAILAQEISSLRQSWTSSN